MKIIVLNGSPKGETSITMQYIKYIQKQFPSHEFKILNISHEIKRLEKDLTYWKLIMDEVQSGEGIIWATPVYYLLVPSQLKRFIELISERHTEVLFNDKYAAALITSVHCFDHTAMNYLIGISEDLGMHFVSGLSPEMNDLTIPQERTNLENFASYYFHAIETKSVIPRNFSPLNYEQKIYSSDLITDKPKTGNKKIVLLTDDNAQDKNLRRMIETFRKSLPNPLEIINIHSIDIKGGCQGCIHCGYDNICAYQDGLKNFIDTKLIPADAIIFSGTIKDRYLSSRWKMFFDRSFVYGHIPYLKNKQIGFILSGPFRQLGNLRELFEGYVQFQQCTLTGFVTDEDDSEEVTRALETLADKFIWALEHDLKTSKNYLGYGVHLLMQDFVYRSRGIFQTDHRYYKKHGLYNKPGRNGTMNTFLTVINKFPAIRREFQKNMKPSMISHLKKIVEMN